MRSFRPLFRLPLLVAACGVFLPVVALAQDCDYMVVDAGWAPHPSPDSIYVYFVADVVGPISTNPASPSRYDMTLNVRFDGALVDTHELTLQRWANPNNCTAGCPSVVCRHEDWSFKGVLIPQDSRCTLNAQSVCGCPPLGAPVAHQKVVRKPPGPVTIEIEIIPLSLVSCRPINPNNDRKQFSYSPSQGVPGLDDRGVMALGVLLLTAAAALVGRGKARAA